MGSGEIGSLGIYCACAQLFSLSLIVIALGLSDFVVLYGFFTLRSLFFVLFLCLTRRAGG